MTPAQATRDPGLQVERTSLAWRRTALSAMVTAVLLVNQVVQRGSTAATIPGLLAASMMLGLAGIGHLRARRLRAGRTTSNSRPVSAGAGAVVLGALAAGLAGFLSR
ncbi:DUF202 domain-containing protein [Rhodococcus sp. NPDC127528]|uniref:DUF202 domain-containing protein n=1 Tax=unclassified Rhodococcus (in: high G+C Gram-positive bacteria) TaxID=192944 RepID=UPI00362B06D5